MYTFNALREQEHSLMSRRPGVEEYFCSEMEVFHCVLESRRLLLGSHISVMLRLYSYSQLDNSLRIRKEMAFSYASSMYYNKKAILLFIRLRFN